jgi:hypothetical protein
MISLGVRTPRRYNRLPTGRRRAQLASEIEAIEKVVWTYLDGAL